jgi:hypothetical protein
MDVAGTCELYADSFWGQPVTGVTSLAFVVSGAAILAGRRGREGRVPYALLVIGIGVGSFIQHGPNPSWQAWAHDVPLAGTLAFVAGDAASDVTGRRLAPLWWIVPTAAVVPIAWLGPEASMATQSALAAAAIGLNLHRARIRPRLRRVLLTSLGILGTGALIGTLGDRTSLCRPDSLLQGHAAWHILAALALWWLAPAIGSRTAPAVAGLRAGRPSVGGV